MKGCYLFQRSFAPLAHAMAYVFLKKYGVSEHCALVSLRKNIKFLTEQNDVKYSGLLLDEEIHAQYKNEKIDFNYLSWLEKEFGLPNLWPYLTIDRLLTHGQFLRFYPYDRPAYSHEELLKILQVNARAIINFLDKEKPDFVFLSTPGSLCPYLLGEIARKKGIPLYMGELSRLKNNYLVSEDPNGYFSLGRTFLKIRNKEIKPTEEEIKNARTILNEYNETTAIYDDKATPELQPLTRRKQMKFLLPQNFIKSLYFLYKTTADYYFGPQSKDYTQINPWYYFYDRLMKKFRTLIGYDDLYDEVSEAENFVYFSLSLEPELNLLYRAPFAADQLNVIKQLAFALPIHYKLYVKEHPHMFGFRTRKFYKELKKIPNVKLISPKIKSHSIIKKSKLVVSINGTANWEALLLYQKPSISFGHAFYNHLSMVKYCTSMHNLASLVKEQLENFKYDDQELIDFIIALLRDSTQIDIIRLWRQYDHAPEIKQAARQMEPLVDLLAKKFNLPIKGSL